MKSLMTAFAAWAHENDEMILKGGIMAKKANTCCFCERKYIISEWGATSDTGKTLCIDCVSLIYNGIVEEIEQQGMGDN